MAARASYHDAKFTQYLFFDGVSNLDVGGRQLTLSPHILASAGILYTPSPYQRPPVTSSEFGSQSF